MKLLAAIILILGFIDGPVHACALFETCRSAQTKRLARATHAPAQPRGAADDASIRLKALEEEVTELKKQQLLSEIQLSAWARSVTQAHSRIDTLASKRN